MYYLRADNVKLRQRIVINFISGMTIFMLIAGLWVALISHKYGHFTVGTAGAYNRSLTEQKSSGSPIFYAGLFDPPNNTAVSIWEDVSNMKVVSWNIFDSFSTVIYEIKIICKNILGILVILNQFSILLIPLLLITFVRFIKSVRQIVHDNIFYIVLIQLILFSGYAIIWIDPRFFWLSNILMIIIGGKILTQAFTKNSLRRKSRIVLTGLFVISFLVLPVRSMYRSSNNSKQLIELSNRLNKLNIKGRIASAGDWDTSLYLSFHNSWQYYGRSGNFGETYIENELKTKNIDYYFVWESYVQKMNFLEKYEEISGGDIAGLKIYKLK
jgi:hypothetical protein